MKERKVHTEAKL